MARYALSGSDRDLQRARSFSWLGEEQKERLALKDHRGEGRLR